MTHDYNIYIINNLPTYYYDSFGLATHKKYVTIFCRYYPAGGSYCTRLSAPGKR